MASRGILTTILTLGISALLRSDRRPSRPHRGARRRPAEPAAIDGRASMTATVEIDPRSVRDLRLEYAPDRNGAPDAGEIVWTWVPYAENDGRGKDRPVLIVGRHTADRVYAVKLTSKDKQGRDDRLAIGSGAWDAQGRPSWVDIDQLYSVHRDGLRREAAALDRDRFARVAQALQHEFGWRAA